MNRENTTYTITVDPEFDLHEAGYCSCELCCERFATEFIDVVATLAEEEGVHISVEVGHYKCCSEDVDPLNLWQQAHDWIGSDWTDHEDLDDKQHVLLWDDVTSYTATFPMGNEPDGSCVVNVWIGHCPNGYWYGRTTDDAGGDDFAPDCPIGNTREEAFSWAENFSLEKDEA